MTDFPYSNYGLNGEPEHTGDVMCWCAPTVEHHPGGDVIIHNSLAEIVSECTLVARQIAMGEAAVIAQTWPDQPTAQIGRGWDEYAVATAIALAIRAAAPAIEVDQGAEMQNKRTPVEKMLDTLTAQDAELAALRAELAEAQARGDTYRRRALVLVRRAATERSWYKFALVVADAQDAELAAAEAERDRARAALAEAQARLSYATQLVADGLEVARIGSELATADQLGEWPNVEGFQVEAANFLAGIMPPAPVTPPGGEEQQ